VTHVFLATVLGAAILRGLSVNQPAPSVHHPSAAAEPVIAAAAPRQAGGAARSTDPVAGAYFEFLLGRQLEDKGDVDGAAAAFQRAMKLDPASADVPAELAGLYARQSRLRESIEAANAALAINAAHGEANRVLGSIYASLAERNPNGAAPGAGQQSYRQLALEHLEKATRSSSPMTAAGVRLTLARLQMQASAFDKAIPVLRQLLADGSRPQGVATLLGARRVRRPIAPSPC
jgi:tetratricopeptide (TPR) repeat protein